MSDEPWNPIDLLLEQGSREELDRMRQQVAKDPMRALDLADTVQFVEQFRHLRTDAGPKMAGKMQDVVLQADRFCRAHHQPKGPTWHLPLLFGVAAAATFWALCWFDAASLWRGEPERNYADLAEVPLPQAERERGDDPRIEPVVVEDADHLWRESVRAIQQRLAIEESEHLRSAFERGLRGERDELGGWLDPANALTMMRLGHELRASADLRAAALREQGALEEVDGRVQELAEELADELMQRPLGSGEQALAADLVDVAWGMRALIGAGSTTVRVHALRRCGDWLAETLPEVHDERLVVALSGLVELAAISGQHFEEVAAHGRRLIDEVLEADEENWQRRRPALLSGSVPALVLGEAGRVLAHLPAFGVDAQRCTLVRELVLGRLREHRALGQDRPEVLAAMVYGFSDLLDAGRNERDRLNWTLQRWKPARLAPDYATVQQIAWSLSPGTRGHTRMQRELRQLAVLPAPERLRDRAAFCLCLATNYAGFVGGLMPKGRPVRGS
ncbi:MAG: hypothetical protein ACE37K_02765 [Planctomycetota bacterium]